MIGPLDIVRQLVEEHCSNLYCSDVTPSGMNQDENLECLVLHHEDSIWVHWVFIFYESHYVLCKDETFENPGSSRGVRRVNTIFGIQVNPIYIHDQKAADKLTNLLKKLNAITQHVP